MKENIIGVVSSEETVTIKVSTLIDLLTVPTAIRMQSIRADEEQGFSQKELHPNREDLTKYLECALSGGYVVPCFTTELGLKGLGNNQIGWARDYLILLYESINLKGALTTSKDDQSAETL